MSHHLRTLLLLAIGGLAFSALGQAIPLGSISSLLESIPLGSRHPGLKPRPSQTGSQLPASQKKVGTSFVPGELLVRFREGYVADKRGLKTLAVEADGRSLSISIEAIGSGPEIVNGLRLARVAPADMDLALKALRSRPDVIYAEPNFIRRKSVVPNDANYPAQWALHNTGQNGGTAGVDIKAEQAWEKTTGSRNIVVGIVDEGIDIDHPDLKDNIWKNPAEIPGNGIDDDGDGLIDDVNGWDFLHNDNTVFDYSLTSYPPPTDYQLDLDDHGTHVAGIIGAIGNNSAGVAGVNWQVSLLPLKFLGPAGGTTADLLKALAYARTLRTMWESSGGSKGANIRVLNNSYGGYEFSQAELDAINSLAQANILFVAAAGNDGISNDLLPQYPASYEAPNVISVGASGRSDGVPSFSNYGMTVNLSAPGVEVISTTPRETYFFASGSSMSSAFVAGSAALAYSSRPNTSLDTMRAALMFNGQQIDPQWTLSGRRLNLAGTLQALEENDNTPPGPAGNFHVSFQNRQLFALQWTASGDDANTGRAALYEIRFSDQPFTDQTFDQASRLIRSIPATAGSTEQATVYIPYRHPSGFIGIRSIDNLGNKSPISSVPVSDDPNFSDPYTFTEGPATSLSTGGIALGLRGDDVYRNYALPINFPFFNGGNGVVWVTSNGALYIPIPPNNTNVARTNSGQELITSRTFERYTLIAGLWDDLRTDRRTGDDVYVVLPDAAHPDRVIFRWQGVTYDREISPGVTRGENPVSFEIELDRDGTIILRYGDGNHNVLPIVGVSGGSDSYRIDSHTSPTVLKDLTNAPAITFSPRLKPPPQLQLSLTTSSTVFKGEQLTYSAVATNNGPSPAPDAVLDIALSPGQTFISCSGVQTCQGPAPGTDGGVVHAVLGTMGNRTSATVQVVTSVTQTGGFSVSATATFSCGRSDANNAISQAISNVLNDLAQSVPFLAASQVSTGAGASHTVALRQGTVWEWGYTYGGPNTNTMRYAVPVPGLTSVISIASGSNFSLALREDGTVWAWGSNQAGQLGTTVPVASQSGVPVQVNGLTSISAIAAGDHCLALKSDGTVWAWGANFNGALGIGSSDNNPHPIPTQVAGLPGIAKILTGPGFSIAITKDDGSLWVWGNNFTGQLGDGTTTTRFQPVHLLGLPHFKAVTAGDLHVVALADDSTLWSWGFNRFGQLGIGTADTSPHATPAQVPGMQARAIAAGLGHTLIQKLDGTVWAFGNNSKGQLANGGIDISGGPHPIPNQVPGLNNVTAIFAGTEFSLAMEDTPAGSQIKAWGSNERGALGDGTVNGRTSPVVVIENAVVAAPIFGNPGGTFSQPIAVTINCGTPGSTIRFTTNGQDPALSDQIILSGSPVIVDHPVRLKAQAWKTGLATSGITSADFNVSPANPIDITATFVTQHYVDFLGRQPDAAGLQFWMNNVDSCGFDSNCREVQRINTSASFFLSIEFQQTGYLVERFYKIAYGNATGNSTFGGAHQLTVPIIRFDEFSRDSQRIGQGVIVLTPGWEQLLESNKQSYAQEFVQTSRFVAAFPTTMAPTDFVDKLNQNAGNVLSASERAAATNLFGSAPDSSSIPARAQAVRQIAEDTDLYSAEYNRAFVLAEYYGYLRRDPNSGQDTDYTGYDFWLTKLNQFNGNYINAEMVKAFLSSIEYRQRFGP